MTWPRRAPARDEVDAWFAAVLAGTASRDEADRWAAQWFTGDADRLVHDEHVWWALGLLYGVDLPADRTGTFLHDDEQVREWLAEFRARCAASPMGDG
ncbi:hypothetical protein Ais01nite_80880 [Asanoa ishikariensis]|uniref:Uncharacterized protein n=1 Tax=Asanoa ishikariensis TaxID=137265 RepID=A0A1H3UYH4_9ACTN|nr:hypothetical protein [Asanoa ishikariensis]GIF70053.1 hypothetical protein Ais01nite_80880 [Asanoa ishikariensis]SDZ67407.1 hypothetical protein SAMN05421684_8431 [Asanoa ishikariensis]